MDGGTEVCGHKGFSKEPGAKMGHDDRHRRKVRGYRRQQERITEPEVEAARESQPGTRLDREIAAVHEHGASIGGGHLEDPDHPLVVDLTLASFVTGVGDLQIPQLSLFYFRREGAAASATSESTAAESLTIPGPVIAVRTTLPPRASELRDAVTVSGWPRSRWIVSGVGWSAVVLLLAGLAWQAVHVVRGRKRREGPDPRKAMAAIRERWLEAVPSDFADPGAVMEFYGRSYRDVKEYLGYLLETPTEGLLADELRAEMMRLAASPDLTERTAKVLSVCETARYARHPAELNGAAARELADDMRAIFHTT